MIKRNYFKVVRVYPDPGSYFYIKNETMSENEVGAFIFASSRLDELNLEYSLDKVNWTRVTNDNKYLHIPADGYMYFRNTTGVFGTDTQVFTPRGDISIGGDIRTLFNYTDVESVTAIPSYGFYQLFAFQGDAKCLDISNLSFRGITEIGDYGLYHAFSNGFLITKGVDLRDVTTLGDNALECLYYQCRNLTEAYAPNVSTWDTSKTYDWLNDVASSGTVYKPANLTIPTNDFNGIPEGWTAQTYPTE